MLRDFALSGRVGLGAPCRGIISERWAPPIDIMLGRILYGGENGPWAFVFVCHRAVPYAPRFCPFRACGFGGALQGHNLRAMGTAHPGKTRGAFCQDG